MRAGIINKLKETEKKIIDEIKLDSYHFFSHVDDFIESMESFDLLICNVYTKKECIDILKKIRRSNHYLLPVFCPIDIDKNFGSDGNYRNIKLTLNKTEKIIKYLKTLQKSKTSSWQEKVLFYLYTRPDLLLESKNSVNKKTYHYYPLLEVFTDEENIIIWLEELTHQGFVNKLKLNDKVYTCPDCNSINLKFTPHCPECDSINIKSENFLHCFTCGFNGPEDEFLQKNKLSCPNCQTNLRLYGSDYDRPLENLLCLDCKNVFIEPNTKTTCLSCGNKTEADKLKIIDIYDFNLSEAGHEKIKAGILSIDYFMDSNNFITYDLFLSTLDWFIKAQTRYNNQNFELIGIKLPLNNLNDYNLFQNFCKSLYNIIREVDITTRAPDGTIWIVFPFINKNNERIILTKIKNLYSEFYSKQPDNDKTPIKHINFFSSIEKVKKISANILISQLSGNL